MTESRMKLPAVVREINVFVLVGLAATACHAGVALATQRFAGLGPMSATLAGYVASVGVSYFGNALLTFRRPALHGPQAAKFATISLAGLAINQSVVFVFAHLMGWPLKFALIPVVIVVPTSTFVLSKFWAFRAPTLEPAQADAGAGT
ncbi:MAG TPA: GtrA family protein [Caulobacteraceae bacterium]|jgi:putative flippase GtrA